MAKTRTRLTWAATASPGSMKKKNQVPRRPMTLRATINQVSKRIVLVILSFRHVAC